MSRKKAFISHITSETELAQRLKQHLEQDFLGMLEVFVSSDRETIRAGSKWLEEVDKALRSADLEIVLCSTESVGRPWVNFEAGAVWLRGIPVVPLCHSGLRPNDLPVPLGMLEGIECGQPDGLQKLYDTIAGELGVGVPKVDFSTFAAELGQFEKKYIQARASLETIVNPRVLCGASEFYALNPQIGFQLDVNILQRTFPNRVRVESNLTQQRLRELLIKQQFDIVHLVVPLNPENGDLVFSSLSGTPDITDTMSPDGFCSLLVESNTSLVILATCNAPLLLVVEVAKVANMAACDRDLSGEEAAKWEECFYGLLAGGKSLFKAFDITKSQSNAPIRAVRHKDVVFALTEKNSTSS